MKKALTILMLTLSLATFAQNATKVVVLDTYNKGNTVRQSILTEVKTNLAQAFSDLRGFEGIMSDKVDCQLLAEGFAEQPHLSREQTKWMSQLVGTQYTLMSEAAIDDYGYLIVRIVLVDLDAYQTMASESIVMNDKLEDVHKGCESLVKKIIVYLPEPQESVAENETEQTEQPLNTTKPSTKQEDTEAPRTYAMPLEPQQLTRLEADQVSRHLKRAEVCIEMNYIDDAIKEYNEIVEIAPNWPNVYMYLGNTYSLKGDDASLGKAIENYKKFMQMTDDRELYYEAQDKLSRVEMMIELKGKEAELEENFVGKWRSALYNKYTGQPWFIMDINRTPETNKFQITLSPKSLMFNNIVNKKAYAEIIDGKIGFSYTFQETYIPKQSNYNLAGAIVNSLFSDSPLVAALGNVAVESLREGDVGYTNIMDFDFITKVDIKDDLYKGFADAYMDGSCHFKGEHHQAGRSNVGLDTIYHCALLKGDEYYPVFEKIQNIGGKYYYGDIILTGKNPIINYSPYISKEEWAKEQKKLNTRSALYGTTCGFALGGFLCGIVINKINENSGDPKFFGDTYLVVTGVASGTLLIMCITTTAKWNNFLKKCYNIHNKQVDENIRKYRQRDQAGVSVNVGLTPTGAGVYLNF